MNINLEKDGQTLSYKTGNAFYLLLSFIPVVGSIVVLVLTIMRKQFRGILLNQFIIGLISILVLFLSIFTGSEGIISFVYILLLVFMLVVYVNYVVNANYYSIKQRLEEGYTVVNADDAEVQAAIAKANNVKFPFWQITKF